MPEKPDNETSWEKVSDWYGRLSGKDGSYYYQHIVLPGSLRLLDLKQDSSLLDLACGQGILARQIPPEAYYAGLDLAPSLITQAKRLDKNKRHVYAVADVGRKLPVTRKGFTHAALIMALQNLSNGEGVIANAGEFLGVGGKLLVVLNHPCFRIPRQTSWSIDPQNKLQFRRIDRYMTPLRVPITMNPGRGEKSETTWSYHFPISWYAGVLSGAGFVIEKIEEWTSDKHSVGAAAKMENRARQEFPLFMAMLASKR